MFAYRWRVLGGIGGYNAMHLAVISSAKALFLRIWAVLFFSLNWNGGMEIYAALGLATGILAYVGLTFSRPVRRDLGMAMAWILLCAAPAIQMLLIGPDLLNSRQLYLPAAGMTMLLAGAIESLPKWRWAAGAALLVFFVASLEHNLTIRARVGELARETCVAAAKSGKIADPPKIVDGVWMLGNWFDQCVEMQEPKR
jgi:hypothetical protein